MNEQTTAHHTQPCDCAWCRFVTEQPIALLHEERRRQDAKWGEQNHDAATWFLILMEEVGEVAQAVLRLPVYGEDPPGAMADEEALHDEVVQVAAVCVAWLEAHDRGRASVRPKETRCP